MGWCSAPTGSGGCRGAFATTPARPAALLAAQLLANLLILAVSLLAVYAVGVLVVSLSTPDNLVGFAVVLGLGALSLYGIGLLLASFLASQRAANAVAWAVFRAVGVPRRQATCRPSSCPAG